MAPGSADPRLAAARVSGRRQPRRPSLSPPSCSDPKGPRVRVVVRSPAAAGGTE
uniref:Uncharacterized protein n=1 Tax=Arundo donax TaxID=35708 RepID=A0A0A9AH02_ARUDO